MPSSPPREKPLHGAQARGESSSNTQAEFKLHPDPCSSEKCFSLILLSVACSASRERQRGIMCASMETETSKEEFPGRWRDVQKLLTRGSPLVHPEFEPSDQVYIL